MVIPDRPVKNLVIAKPKIHPPVKKQLKPTINTAERTPLKMKSEQKDEQFPATEEQGEDEKEEGDVELDELTARVLNEELGTFMAEVTEPLSDASATLTEENVEKVRNVLRNLVGLNVTKRLLNVYNPLYVKISFSCRPEPGCLTKFLDQYKVTSFRRINEQTNTFAARLGNITDFDNICNAENIECGSSKVTVTTCYRFSRCPRNLRTPFAYKGHCVFKQKREDNLVFISEGDNVQEDEVKDAIKNEKESTSAMKEKEAVQAKETSNKPKNEVSEKVKPKEKEKVDILKSPGKKNIEITKETKIVKSPVVKPKATVKESPKEKQTNIPCKTDKKMIQKNIPIKRSQIKMIESEVDIYEDEINESEINEFNEGEELNDEEILALISTGNIADL